jgi:hypothetical protein
MLTQSMRQKEVTTQHEVLKPPAQPTALQSRRGTANPGLLMSPVHSKQNAPPNPPEKQAAQRRQKGGAREALGRRLGALGRRFGGARGALWGRLGGAWAALSSSPKPPTKHLNLLKGDPYARHQRQLTRTNAFPPIVPKIHCRPSPRRLALRRPPQTLATQTRLPRRPRLT